MAQETKSQSAERAKPLPAEAGELFGGLKQIQKIIVEPRARELESALKQLDERRMKDLADLRKEVDRSINRSDDFIKKESSVLSERLSAERRERESALEERARDLQSRVRQLDERIAKLEEKVIGDTRDLRQLILDQYRGYSEELRTWRDDMARAIAHDLSGLRTEKADRTVLAELLEEVGERLAGKSEPLH